MSALQEIINLRSGTGLAFWVENKDPKGHKFLKPIDKQGALECEQAGYEYWYDSEENAVILTQDVYPAG